MTASGERVEAKVFVQRFWLTEPVASRSKSVGLLAQAQRQNNAAVCAIKCGLMFASSRIGSTPGLCQYTSKARIVVLAPHTPVTAMGKAAKTSRIQRRMPQRPGSRETVDVIFEATARILASAGRAGLNTNRIAEVAGVSVGGLYGYFPNKEAILLAMARRELDHVRDRVLAALTRGEADVHPVRRAIRALIKGYGTRGKVRRILMETLFANGGSEDMARPIYEVAEIILAHADDILPKGAAVPSHIGLFVLTRAVDGVIRTATYEGVDFLMSPTFEDELTRLVMGYFSTPGWNFR